MKKVWFILSTFLILLLFACNSTTESSTNDQFSEDQSIQKKLVSSSSHFLAEVDSLNKIDQQNIDLSDSLSKTLVVGNNNFNLLKDYILENGEWVYETGDKQYVFFDSKGARHCFMYINPDGDWHLRPDHMIGQISVWSYKNGKKNSGDLSNFVGYEVYKDYIRGCVDNSMYEDYPYVKRGYEEFLKHASNT